MKPPYLGVESVDWNVGKSRDHARQRSVVYRHSFPCMFSTWIPPQLLHSGTPASAAFWPLSWRGRRPLAEAPGYWTVRKYLLWRSVAHPPMMWWHCQAVRGCLSCEGAVWLVPANMPGEKEAWGSACCVVLPGGHQRQELCTNCVMSPPVNSGCGCSLPAIYLPSREPLTSSFRRCFVKTSGLCPCQKWECLYIWYWCLRWQSEENTETLPAIQFVKKGPGNTRQDAKKVDEGWAPDTFVKFMHDVWQEHPVKIEPKCW